MEISKILVSKTRKKGFILDTVQRGKKWSNCHEVGRVRQQKRGYCEGSWKLCAAIFIASLFFAACLTSDSRAKETERSSLKEREREWEQGTVCIVCALFGRFRVNVNYQNCFGTWLTDSKPKAIKIFMTHWVITSNPQTWVMPRPLPQCLPRTFFFCSRARSKDVRNFRELKGKIYAQRPKENVKRRRTTGDIKKIYCFMISSSSRRLHKKKKKGSRNCNCFLPEVALRS